MNDVVWNKKASIERCIRQIRAYYALPCDVPLADNHLIQDAIAINMQRACKQSIDLATYTIRSRKLGLLQESKESFQLLAENHIIPRDLAVKLGNMVGFRNTLVHEYQTLDISLMVDVIEHHLDDLLDFTTSSSRNLSIPVRPDAASFLHALCDVHGFERAGSTVLSHISL